MDTIYNRPLFRQMGGMAMPSPQEQMAMQQPMPMPQPMVSPEQIGEQMAQVESDAGAMGVGIGQELVNRMMQGLDSAETPKDLMDSIRGNDRSVDERRTELAEFVGEEDAEQTPETVLAMVQPTIMLTERGAMDSGVGELMEGVADIDMETMEGEPTDVGGGVASLMGVGQPPVQNFRDGGIVQKFRLGGNPINLSGRNISPQPKLMTFSEAMQEGSKIAKSLYPDQNDFLQKMAALQFANLGVTTGLGLAGGTTPSGRRLQGNFLSKAAQIGTELSPAFTQAAMQVAQAQQAQKQKERDLGFQIGSSLYSADRETKTLGPDEIMMDPKGNIIGRGLPKTLTSVFEQYVITTQDGSKKIRTFDLTKANERNELRFLEGQGVAVPYENVTPNRKTFEYVMDGKLVRKEFDVANNNQAIIDLENQGIVVEPAGKLEQYTVSDKNTGDVLGSFATGSIQGSEYYKKQYKEGFPNIEIKVEKMGTESTTDLTATQLSQRDYDFLVKEGNMNRVLTDPDFAKRYVNVATRYLGRTDPRQKTSATFAKYLPTTVQDFFEKARADNKEVPEFLLNKNIYPAAIKEDVETVVGSDSGTKDATQPDGERTEGEKLEETYVEDKEATAASGYLIPKLKGIVNTIVGLGNEITNSFGGTTIGLPYKDVRTAQKQFESLRLGTLDFLMDSGRILKDEFKEYINAIPVVGTKTIEDTTADLNKIISTLDRFIDIELEKRNVEGVARSDTQEGVAIIVEANKLRTAYESLLQSHENEIKRRQYKEEKGYLPIDQYNQQYGSGKGN